MTETRQKRIQSFAFVISIIIAACLFWAFSVNIAGPEQKYKIELDEKIKNALDSDLTVGGKALTLDTETESVISIGEPSQSTSVTLEVKAEFWKGER